MRQKRFRLIFIALLLLAAGLGAIYLIAGQSLPQVAGELAVPGLAAPVDVLRDANGVPHIFARSEADAHFALGFVHAQDRLWQMEMNRRIAAGRLAEVLGPAALDTDRFLRTLDIRRVAEANVRALDADSRRLLAAYAAGVNAFLATKPILPPEFWLLGVTAMTSDGIFSRILVPTDFSAGSERAWAVAQRMATNLGAELVLLHVLPGTPLDVETLLASEDRKADLRSRQAEHQLGIPRAEDEDRPLAPSVFEGPFTSEAALCEFSPEGRPRSTIADSCARSARSNANRRGCLASTSAFN